MKKLFIPVALFVLDYTLMSFIFADYNFTNWGVDARSFLILIWVISSAVYVFKDNIKEVLDC